MAGMLVMSRPSIQMILGRLPCLLIRVTEARHTFHRHARTWRRFWVMVSHQTWIFHQIIGTNLTESNTSIPEYAGEHLHSRLPESDRHQTTWRKWNTLSPAIQTIHEYFSTDNESYTRSSAVVLAFLSNDT